MFKVKNIWLVPFSLVFLFSLELSRAHVPHKATRLSPAVLLLELVPGLSYPRCGSDVSLCSAAQGWAVWKTRMLNHFRNLGVNAVFIAEHFILLGRFILIKKHVRLSSALGLFLLLLCS